jgi:predicted amidohydrolase YtcJ
MTKTSTANIKFLVALFCLTFITNTRTFAQRADIILTNGKIFTSDSSKLYVQALAIKSNKILAVGNNNDIERFASNKTRKIDLKGKTVVPGFNDAHDHLGWLIPTAHSSITEFSILGLSKSELTDTLAKLLKASSPGQWIQVTIGLTVFNDTTIRRKLLDSIAPENPLVLQIMWGHGMIVNSPVLKDVHISDTAANPLGGWYERKQGSKYITGALYEYAQFPVWEKLTISDTAALINALRLHANEELALGITTVQNMSGTMQGNAARWFFTKANLPLRVRIIPMPKTTVRGRELGEWRKENIQLTPFTYISGIKYMIDGTPLEQTALMTTPYPNRNNWYGRLDFPADTIKQILKEALITNRQVMLHVVGDSATKIVLNLMKQIASGDKWKEKRVRIEHGVGITTETSINDVRNLGVVIDHTPQYGKGSPIRMWMDMKIPVAIGPDALINPYLNIMFMTAQQADSNQNISREQAVIAYTKGSAYAEFAEKYKGTLMPGMLADLAVLSQDIFSVPASQLPAIKSVLTIIDGKIVYQKDY